jgi:hypothetical protein
MSTRTMFLSRLIGLYCILVALAFGAHKQATLDAVTAVIHNTGILMILGVFTLVAGLAIVLAHNIWSGGATPVIVTVIGWISIVKGLFFLLLSPDAMAALTDTLHYAQLFYLYMTVNIVIGLYLTINGFRRSAWKGAEKLTAGQRPTLQGA